MRGVKALIAGTALLGALVAASEPTFAQSFLQRLFGGFVGARMSEYRFSFGRMGPSGYGSEYDEGGWQEDLGTYRTLCVRTCDGFYFPISDSVRRERLHHDSHACMQRCDGEARLFYYPTAGGSVETMVDLAGHPYADLPNAFRYRKALVDACTCKPAPWSAQETARHQGYAAEAAERHGAPEVDEGRGAPPGATRAARVEGDPYAAEYEAGPPRTYRRWPQSRWERRRYGWDND